MQVLLVLPGSELGGVQTHVFDLATGLAARGIEARVATGSDGPLVARLVEAGIPVHVVPMRRRGDLAATRALQRLAAQPGLALVHTHGPLAGLLGRAAARRAQRPAVHTLHGLGVLDELRAATGWLHRLKLLSYAAQEAAWNKRSARVIAVAPAVAAAALAAGHVSADTLRVIPNGVDAADTLPSPSRERRACYIGRLHREKGVLMLPAALEAARTQCPDIRLCIVGDGPEREALVRGFGARGLSEAIEWCGELADPTPVLERTACLIAPSRAEGLSYVLLEAMARGVPCVATAVGGTPDLIVDGASGVLVPAGDGEALGRTVGTLLADPAYAAALGRAAWARVRTTFSRERMVDDIAALYREVLAG